MHNIHRLENFGMHATIPIAAVNLHLAQARPLGMKAALKILFMSGVG